MRIPTKRDLKTAGFGFVVFVTSPIWLPVVTAYYFLWIVGDLTMDLMGEGKP